VIQGRRTAGCRLPKGTTGPNLWYDDMWNDVVAVRGCFEPAAHSESLSLLGANQPIPLFTLCTTARDAQRKTRAEWFTAPVS